jgi:hypothetical protein
MNMIVDEDVRAVAQFMQERLPASRLVPVADGIAAIAPLLWGHFQREEVRTLRLKSDPISSCVEQTQSAANE